MISVSPHVWEWVTVCVWCVRERRPQCSPLLLWIEIPGGWRLRGSAQKLPRPPRCGTADASGTDRRRDQIRCVFEREEQTDKKEEVLPLTQMSHFPGKNLSGIRAAYRQAPVMYRVAMSSSQPICPMVVALIRPSLMTKWRVGTTPLRPRPTNTPDNKHTAVGKWVSRRCTGRKARRYYPLPALTPLYCGVAKKSHWETVMAANPSMHTTIR